MVFFYPDCSIFPLKAVGRWITLYRLFLEKTVRCMSFLKTWHKTGTWRVVAEVKSNGREFESRFWAKPGFELLSLSSIEFVNKDRFRASSFRSEPEQKNYPTTEKVRSYVFSFSQEAAARAKQFPKKTFKLNFYDGWIRASFSRGRKIFRTILENGVASGSSCRNRQVNYCARECVCVCEGECACVCVWEREGEMREEVAGERECVCAA